MAMLIIRLSSRKVPLQMARSASAMAAMSRSIPAESYMAPAPAADPRISARPATAQDGFPFGAEAGYPAWTPHPPSGFVAAVELHHDVFAFHPSAIPNGLEQQGNDDAQ
jgi:hypothetical protein